MPVIIMLLSRVMEHLDAVNVAVQPASQSCPMEMRSSSMDGKSLIVVAAEGSPVIGMSPMCVDDMYCPLGSLTLIGEGSILLLVMRALSMRP